MNGITSLRHGWMICPVVILVLLSLGCKVEVKKTSRANENSTNLLGATDRRHNPKSAPLGSHSEGWEIIIGRGDDLSKAIMDLAELGTISPDNAQPGRPGLWFLMDHKPNEAMAALDEYILLHPDNGFAYLVRGELNVRMRNFDKAIMDISEAIRLIPDDMLLHSKLAHAALFGIRGQAYMGKGEVGKAIRDLSHAIGVDPTRDWLYHSRGFAYSRSGQIDKALVDFDTAIKLGPSNALTFCGRAEAYYRSGNYDKAIQDYTQAIQIDQSQPTFYYNRAYAYLDQRELDKAIDDLETAIRLNPDDAACFATRAHIHVLREDFDQALNDYSEAIRLASDDPALYRARASVHLRNGMWEKARDDYGVAVSLDPDDAATENDLAWLLATCPSEPLRNGIKAVGIARRACELSEWEEWRYIGTLAAAYAEAGDFEKAIEYQEKALSLKGMDDNDRCQARERLKLFRQGKPYREGVDSGSLQSDPGNE